MQALGDTLLEKETINLPQIIEILGDRPYGLNESAEKYLKEMEKRQAEEENKANEEAEDADDDEKDGEDIEKEKEDEKKEK